MHKLIALYHQPEDRTQFRDHLLGIHLPLVAAFPGLRAIRVGFDAADPSGAAASYFAVVECEFDDESAMRAALASKAGQAAAADVPNYAGAGVTIVTLEVESVS